MAVTDAITLDTLAALAEQATEHLTQVEAADRDWLTALSTEHARTGARISDAQLEKVVAASCEIHALVHDQQMLQYQSQLLFDEGARIHDDDPAARADHSHKVRQHHDRLLSHLDHIRACLASRRKMT